MSISKSVQKIVFLVVMAISTILLCFVGVWAVQALNLKFTGVVNPDIICKVEVKTPSAQTYTTLFDNYADNSAEDFFDNQNKLKNFTTTLNSTVANELDFRLTNYTPTKHIRLSIQNILIDGNALQSENLLTDHTSASAEMFTEAQPHSSTFTLSFSSNKNGEYSVNLSLLVEEVYKVTTSGTGLANPDSYFFAEDETPKIPLVASVSYQLPKDIIFNKFVDGITFPFVHDTNYTRTNNQTGEATFAKEHVKENVSILCNCDRVFLIEKSTSTSLFENGQSTMQGVVAPFDNTATYLPNNGKYTYSADFGQVTKGDGFKEYPYYINLGEYPQTKVSTALSVALTNALSQQKLTYLTSYNQTINKTSCTIYWYEFQGEKYATSPSLLYGKTQSTTEWFKVEPIVWTILEAQENGETVDLDSLYYDQNRKMFYVDALCGKAFKGSLVLMSAYTLDASAFNTQTNSYANFGTSQIQTFLKDTIGSAYTMDGNSTLYKMLYGYNETNNYIPSTSLQTYSQSTWGGPVFKTDLSSELFFLAGNNQNEETFHASNYFVGGPETDTSIQTTSIATTSPTDYAIAHYIETSASESTSNEINAYNNPNNLASPRGWGVGTAPSSTYVCTNWTRSAYNTNGALASMAHVVNTRGAIRATKINDTHIGVRPCMLFDIGFYYSDTYNYD